MTLVFVLIMYKQQCNTKQYMFALEYKKTGMKHET